jgi:hypothetical protein
MCILPLASILDRLPSAMRPPVQKRGHCRSKSHGGATNQTSLVFNSSVATNLKTYPKYHLGKSTHYIELLFSAGTS